MEPYIKRMIIEAMELDERIEKLRSFLDTEPLDNCNGEYVLMRWNQLHHMTEYRKCLGTILDWEGYSDDPAGDVESTACEFCHTRTKYIIKE